MSEVPLYPQGWHLRRAAQGQSSLVGEVGVTRKVDVRLPGQGNSNPRGVSPVHLIITIITWLRTSKFSLKNSLFGGTAPAARRAKVFRCSSSSRHPRGAGYSGINEGFSLLLEEKDLH